MTNIVELGQYRQQELPRETQKNYAFSLEYSPHVTDKEIEDDVVSYLAEYRLKIPEYTYGLDFSSQDGVWGVRDSYRGDSMQEKTQKALDVRIQNGQSTYREEAELEAFKKLDTALRFAKEGDTLVWGSPPGDSSEGYGDYGFVYHGKIQERDGGKKELKMTAIRVDKAKIDEYNAFFSHVTGLDVDLAKAEDFIANPIVARRDFEDFEMKSLLKENFAGLGSENQENLKEILYQLRPAIRDLIAHVRFSPQDVRQKALYALENMALELKDRMQQNIVRIPKKIRLDDIIDEYGYEPPIERGSCGSTGSSSDIFGMTLRDDEHGGRTFECPTCHLINIRPEGELLRACQHCGSDKVAC